MGGIDQSCISEWIIIFTRVYHNLITNGKVDLYDIV